MVSGGDDEGDGEWRRVEGDGEWGGMVSGGDGEGDGEWRGW